MLTVSSQLIWKKVESNYGLAQYDQAEGWCGIALHTVFQNCGPNNTSKLERYEEQAIRTAHLMC